MAHQISRRLVTVGCAVCGMAAAERRRIASHGCRAISVAQATGSSVQGDELDPNFVIGTTGRSELDYALGRALIRMRDFFDILPGVGLYDDFPPNALTYPESFVPGTRCTVVLGRDLMEKQMAAHNDDGISVVGILAHEFGHVIQYEMQMGDKLDLADGSKKLVELNADFMAGLYLANLSKEPGIQLYETGRTFDALGDTEFGNPDHHGTPQERVAAIEFGFQVGNAKPDLRPRAAFEESVRYTHGTFSK